MRKVKTVPLTTKDFIQSISDVKNYILESEENREEFYDHNEIKNKAQDIFKKIEYISIMVNLDNVFKIAGYKIKKPIPYKQSIAWKFNTLDTKKSNPNVITKKEVK